MPVIQNDMALLVLLRHHPCISSANTPSIAPRSRCGEDPSTESRRFQLFLREFDLLISRVSAAFCRSDRTGAGLLNGLPGRRLGGSSSPFMRMTSSPDSGGATSIWFGSILVLPNLLAVPALAFQIQLTELGQLDWRNGVTGATTDQLVMSQRFSHSVTLRKRTARYYGLWQILVL